MLDGVEQATAVRRSWPLDDASIKRALVRAGTVNSSELSRAQIVSPAGYTTFTPHPHFDVLRTRAESDGGVFVEMRCHQRLACGNFAVEIHCTSKAERLCNVASKRPPTISRAPIRPVLVRAGRPALLVIEQDGLKITETVIPEKRGSMGDCLRVRHPPSRGFLQAQVTGEGLLRLVSTAGRKASE